MTTLDWLMLLVGLTSGVIVQLWGVATVVALAIGWWIVHRVVGDYTSHNGENIAAIAAYSDMIALGIGVIGTIFGTILNMTWRYYVGKRQH